MLSEISVIFRKNVLCLQTNVYLYIHKFYVFSFALVLYHSELMKVVKKI